jgi:hypothetical protein
LETHFLVVLRLHHLWVAPYGNPDCYDLRQSVPWFTFEGEACSEERSWASLGALFVFVFCGLPKRERDSKSAKAIAMDSINAASIAIAHPFKK